MSDKRACDHCGAAVVIDDQDKCFIASEDNVLWCNTCYLDDKNLLAAIGINKSASRFNGYNLWLWEDNIKKLRTIPKKNGAQQNYNPTTTIKLPPEKTISIPEPMELKISIPKSYCKKKYYGINCNCGEC